MYSTATYITLDRRYRVLSRNFWFQAQHFFGGRWRDLAGASRSQEVAVAFISDIQNLSA